MQTNSCGSVSDTIDIINSSDTIIQDLFVCSAQLPIIWNGQNLTANGTYFHSATNALGCDSTRILNLTVNPDTMSITNLTLCSNQLPYVWNGQNLYTTGTYTHHSSNIMGCDSLALLNLNVIHVIKPALEIANFSLVCNNITNASIYVWVECNTQEILDSNSNMLQFIRNGSFKVLVNQNGCLDSSDCKEVLYVDFISNEKEDLFVVYPNPGKDILYVDIPYKQYDFTKINLEIYNGISQLIEIIPISKRSTIIDISTYATGIYYLKMLNQITKVVIE